MPRRERETHTRSHALCGCVSRAHIANIRQCLKLSFARLRATPVIPKAADESPQCSAEAPTPAGLGGLRARTARSLSKLSAVPKKDTTSNTGRDFSEIPFRYTYLSLTVANDKAATFIAPIGWIFPVGMSSQVWLQGSADELSRYGGPPMRLFAHSASPRMYCEIANLPRSCECVYPS